MSTPSYRNHKGRGSRAKNSTTWGFSHPHFQQTAAYYHEHITRNMGVPRFLPGVGEDGLPRSNPQYIELMAKVLEPANYEPLWLHRMS